MASLTLDWIQLAAVVGALQGFALTVTLAAQRNNRTANGLLAALVAAFTIYLASAVYYTTPAFRAFPHLFGVSYQTPWVFGPLVYLYALAAGDRSWRFERGHLVHFVPVLVSTIISMPYFFLSGAEKIALFDQWVSSSGPPSRLAVIDPFKYVSGIAYSAATVLYLRSHRRQIEHSYSNITRVSLAWLSWLSGGTGFIWLMATALQVAETTSRLRGEYVSMAMAILVYGIGYLGLRQPEVFHYETAEFPVQGRSDPVVASPSMTAEPEPARQERSGLEPGEAERLKAKLLADMDKDRPWADSELTLADLAQRLDTTPHKLSELLNSEVGETFYDFVNGYRVRDVQRRIKAGEARARKLLALALDAGFASKSTFNEVFKKHTSQTPSDFRHAVGA